MSYQIGRKFSIGIGKESVRGTAVSASFWLPKMSISVDDKINVAIDDSSVGVIEDSQGQDIVGTYAEGSIEGRVNDTALGLLLLATLGTETSQAAHSGETIVYDHIFNVNESAQHPCLTFVASGPNESTGVAYALGMIDTFEFNMEIGKYAMYKVGFRANKNASVSASPSFSATENVFLPQHGVVKFASALAGLAAASAITLRKVSMSIKKNIEDDMTIGSLAATDRPNKQFAIEGTVELVYQDRSYIDTIMLGDLQKAMRISAVNTAVTIGSAANPAIQFDLAKVKLTEVARKIENNGLVIQTLKYNAFYSMADAKMITATLVNTRSSAY